MKRIFLSVMLAVAGLPALAADRVVVNVFTAQDAANEMARTGILRLCGRNGGCREGIGMGSTAQEALRNCCYYGRYTIRERAVSRGANGRYYAVIRYGN
jgi:hypothetical protein